MRMTKYWSTKCVSILVNRQAPMSHRGFPKGEKVGKSFRNFLVGCVGYPGGPQEKHLLASRRKLLVNHPLYVEPQAARASFIAQRRAARCVKAPSSCSRAGGTSTIRRAQKAPALLCFTPFSPQTTTIGWDSSGESSLSSHLSSVRLSSICRSASSSIGR